MKKSLFLPLALFAFAFAQDKNISIGGSIGYVRAVVDEFEDYPFDGFGFNLGAEGFIPLTDVAKFGSGISIRLNTNKLDLCAVQVKQMAKALLNSENNNTTGGWK